MDAILHIFGVCGDAPVHLDLLDVFLIGAPIGMYVKWNIAETLEITPFELAARMLTYNNRLHELNQRSIDFMKKFILPKGDVIDNKLHYDLNHDDITMLKGFKEDSEKKLGEEFPDLEQFKEELDIFRHESVDITRYLK